MEYNENSRLLFEIEGTPLRRRMKKHQSYIAVYEDRIEIGLYGDYDIYTRDDISDIFIQEPVIEDVDSRTTVIAFREGGQWRSWEIDDDTFPDLAEKMEHVLENEWSHIIKKHDYPETIKWFVACDSVVSIVSGLNPFIFGNVHEISERPEGQQLQRDELSESWGFEDKQDLLDMLPQLLDGRTIKKYQENAGNSAFLLRHERSFRAWDLQRVILLCKLGYFCGYLSWEEALDWCLIAGQKLQSQFTSWDDFMDSYLHGYSIWSGEDLEDEDSEAYERKQVYEHYKKMPRSPWSVQWGLTLTKEW